MASSVVFVCACAALLAVVAATDVQQCPGRQIADLSDKVHLSPCKKPPCRLKKGTNQNITITFVPEKNIKDLVNQVTADVFGVPLPFVGVDGSSVCSKIYTENGEQAPCPLKAGEKYVYKDSFPVLQFYPSIPVTVHWSLKHNDKSIICFEVPARIS